MRWSELSMTEKNEVIKMAVAQGIKDISSIKNLYEESVNGSRRFEDGGKKNRYITTGGAGYTPPVDVVHTWHNLSKDIMIKGHEYGLQASPEHLKWLRNPEYRGAPMSTYLTPRSVQEQIFKEQGYLKGEQDDYGLVKKAVGDRKIPVYQTDKDSEQRKNLTVIGNLNDIFYGPESSRMADPGSFPSAVYVNSEGDIYQKAWDLTDYGDSAGGEGAKYGPRQFAANFLDKLGSPTVITTGYQPALYRKHKWDDDEYIYNIHRSDLFPSTLKKVYDNYLKRNNLHEEFINGEYFPSLPEVTVWGNKKAEGGSIHIAPSKKGTFTAAASKHGMGVQEFASKVLAHPENYSLTMRKKANFARNFGGRK